MKYLLPLILLFSMGCVKDITLDIPEHEPRIAFTGLVQNSITEFFVTLSARENYGSFPGLVDAKVTVSDPQGNTWVAAPGAFDGYYEIPYQFSGNGPLSLSVEKEGYPIATATTGLPGTIQIVEAEGQQAPIIDSQDVFRYFSNYFLDIMVDVQPAPDFHGVLIKPILVYDDPNGRSSTATPSSLTLSQDLPLEYIYVESGFLLNRKDFETLNGRLNIQFSTFTGFRPDNNVRVMMEVALLSSSYDNFLRSAIENLNADIEVLFSDPLPLYTNVEGGYGYFGAIKRDTTTIPVR